LAAILTIIVLYLILVDFLDCGEEIVLNIDLDDLMEQILFLEGFFFF